MAFRDWIFEGDVKESLEWMVAALNLSIIVIFKRNLQWNTELIDDLLQWILFPFPLAIRAVSTRWASPIYCFSIQRQLFINLVKGCCRHVVVLHSDNDLVVHCQPCCVLDRRAHGFTDWKRWRFSEANKNQVRSFERWKHSFILQGEFTLSLERAFINSRRFRTPTSQHIKRCGLRWKHNDRPCLQRVIKKELTAWQRARETTPS